MLRILLLGLFVFAGCSKGAKKPIQKGEFTTTASETLEYYLYYPSNVKEEHPGLLLFLHGGGEAGAELKHLKISGPPSLMEEKYPFPFLVLAPQNPHAQKWWNVAAVHQLLEKVVEEHNIDPSRIYLTGLSRGGYAAWEMAMNYPDTFAATAIVSAMAPTPYAHWLDRSTPIWVFHGEEDAIMPVKEADEMVAKLQQLNFNVRYTRYPRTGHNAWDKAYTTDSLYIWMAQQKRL
ncbi:PHB depolymerase family esterase [Flavobacterium sp. ASW18X]|uniref:carboxylesterase family protein n=1 Tax=Flavobacterium sp. ASW18X TaxID=2572595 RepID=UPI0010ADED95|nr:PHB depolymerase family esterase [Flavobacterium sp. ASW18X]TKD59137.1 alpha/beta hydrolase [Flavobacterium sp. ASW18X]